MKKAIRFFGQQVFDSLLILFSVSVLTFGLMKVLPGGPFDSETALAPELKQQLEVQYGLNDPIFIQYKSFLAGVFTGNLQQSFKYTGKSVGEIIGEGIGPSLALGFWALIVSLFFGLILGTLLGTLRKSKLGTILSGFVSVGLSIPSFVLAPLLVLVFSFKWDLFPPALWDGPKYYVLPVAALSFRPICVFAKLFSSSILEEIGSEHVLSAFAKGGSLIWVIRRHLLTPALIPVLSVLGPTASNLLAGSYVVEMIFAIPGIGMHLVESVFNRDYPLIMTLTLLYCAILIVVNLVFEVMIFLIDPRLGPVSE